MPRSIDTPICFQCKEPIPRDDVLFDPPCGHEGHATAAFHGICMMTWRERREEIIREYEEHIRTEHDDYD